MKKAYRHGEIVFEVIENIPKGLTKSKDKEFLKGSHGNSHTFDNGTLYLKKEDEFIFGYFKAKNTTLFHTEHGTGKGGLKKAKLPDNNYCLRRAVEFVAEGLRQVID